MIKKKIKLVLLASISALVFASCGGGSSNTKFDKAILKEDATPQMEQKQKATLTALGTQPVKDLSPADQQKVTTTVVEYLETVNWPSFSKQMCHADALGHKKCQEQREKCIEEVSKISDEEFKKQLKENTPQIDAAIKNADIAPKDFISALELIDFALGVARELDCDSTDVQLKAAEKKALAEGEAKYGADFEKISEIAKKLIKGKLNKKNQPN